MKNALHLDAGRFSGYIFSDETRSRLLLRQSVNFKGIFCRIADADPEKRMSKAVFDRFWAKMANFVVIIA